MSHHPEISADDSILDVSLHDLIDQQQYQHSTARQPVSTAYHPPSTFDTFDTSNRPIGLDSSYPDICPPHASTSPIPARASVSQTHPRVIQSTSIYPPLAQQRNPVPSSLDPPMLRYPLYSSQSVYISPPSSAYYSDAFSSMNQSDRLGYPPGPSPHRGSEYESSYAPLAAHNMHGVSSYRHSGSSGNRGSISGIVTQEEMVEDRYRWNDGDIAGEYQAGVGYDAAQFMDSSRRDEKMKRIEKRFDRAASGEQRDGGRSVVDGAGMSITAGRKKRIFLRYVQGLGAVGVAIGSIGAAIFTKPLTPPPPSAKLPLYFLYVLPFFSLAITLWLFTFRPCSTRSQLASTADQSRPNSMVIPLLQGGSEYEDGIGCCCFASSRKKEKQQSSKHQSFSQQQPSINLIVDPALFSSLSGHPNHYSQAHDERKAKEKRRRRRRRKERRQLQNRNRLFASDDRQSGPQADSDSDSSSSSTSFGTLSSGAQNSVDPIRSNMHNPRRDLFSSLQSQTKAWQLARSTLKLVISFDVLLVSIWSGASVWAIVFGQACKPGSFSGWCDYYNTAEAISVFLAVAFLTSLVLDVLDWKWSSKSPR